jgi:hypothetical protein
MRRPIFLFSLLAVVLATLSWSRSGAETRECEGLRQAYNAAIEEIADRLRRYANCISDSRGQDDCSFTFRRLSAAHSDFETAVIALGHACRQ